MDIQLECEDFDQQQFHAITTQVWCDKQREKPTKSTLLNEKNALYLYNWEIADGKSIEDGNVKAVRQDYSFGCMAKLSNHCYIILCICACVCAVVMSLYVELAPCLPHDTKRSLFTPV